MNSTLLNRIKKWLIFALIGCVAYFVGYILGHQTKKPPEPPAVGEIKSRPQ